LPGRAECFDCNILQEALKELSGSSRKSHGPENAEEAVPQEVHEIKEGK
jgi:hypothetical protein